MWDGCNIIYRNSHASPLTNMEVYRTILKIDTQSNRLQTNHAEKPSQIKYYICVCIT